MWRCVHSHSYVLSPYVHIQLHPIKFHATLIHGVARGREEQDIFRDKALVCGQLGFFWGYIIEILLRDTCMCTMKKIDKVMADIPGWLWQGEEEYQVKYLYRC